MMLVVIVEVVFVQRRIFLLGIAILGSAYTVPGRRRRPVRWAMDPPLQQVQLHATRDKTVFFFLEICEIRPTKTPCHIVFFYKPTATFTIASWCFSQQVQSFIISFIWLCPQTLFTVYFSQLFVTLCNGFGTGFNYAATAYILSFF